MGWAEAYKILIPAIRKYGEDRVRFLRGLDGLYVTLDGLPYTGQEPEPVPAQELAEWDEWDMEQS